MLDLSGGCRQDANPHFIIRLESIVSEKLEKTFSIKSHSVSLGYIFSIFYIFIINLAIGRLLGMSFYVTVVG